MYYSDGFLLLTIATAKCDFKKTKIGVALRLTLNVKS